MGLASGAPLWPDEWTGVGTVLLAIVTLGAIISTILITRQDRNRADERLADEQARHQAEVDDERRMAEARLRTQQEQSADQFRTEQWRITERERYTEAYAVQITVGELTTETGSPNKYGDAGDATAKRLAALVVNRGRYAITRVNAQFSPDGRSLTLPSRAVRVPASFDSLPKESRLSQFRGCRALFQQAHAVPRGAVQMNASRVSLNASPVSGVAWPAPETY